MMGKTPCIVCTKNLGWTDIGYGVEAFEKSEKLIPEGMTSENKVCNKCFNEIKTPKDIENTESIQMKNERYQKLKERVPKYKPNWDKGGVIEYKDEYCAVLHRSVGSQVEFLIAFSDLTKEGYRMMAQDEGKTGDAGGIMGGLNSYYYFQKIEYVTPKE